MSVPNPIPAGSDLLQAWSASFPGQPPKFPQTWTATVLLSPFGDLTPPLQNYSQIVVGTIETVSASWMRARLYLTQDEKYFDFVFVADSSNPGLFNWFWIDSTPQGAINNIFGPFSTTLIVPAMSFFSGALWGNAYPLMCSAANQKGIACRHWVLQTPGDTSHGTWCSFRQDTGNLFRMFLMDSNNPLMVPILGSYYIANLPTFTPNKVSTETQELITKIQAGGTIPKPDYWNPLVTQQDLQRAMAVPLASASCSVKEIQAIIPGFTAVPSGVPLPVWSDRTYIEGWTLGTDFIPYFFRSCYLWTGNPDSIQQSIFIGLGTAAGQGNYLVRSDNCLNLTSTTQPYYVWQGSTNSWLFNQCIPGPPPVGMPFPDWVARSQGRVMAQITGNADFGLGSGQQLNLIAAELPRGGGEKAIFWVWFLGDGTGMLFTEGNFVNPTSHNLQLIDYNVFVQNAPLTQKDIDNPCAATSTVAAHGHPTRLIRR
jgi:hypothetical protein